MNAATVLVIPDSGVNVNHINPADFKVARKA
jgi:hypothetical protein